MGNRKYKCDFQKQKTYDFHYSKPLEKEKIIPPHDATNIVKQLDNIWNLNTIDLYPEKYYDFGESWPLSKRYAAMNIPLQMLSPSCICHEHAHGVVECYRTYMFKGKKLNDYGHGPLWAGVFAYNISVIFNQDLLDIINIMKYYGLYVINAKSILEFKQIFLNF